MSPRYPPSDCCGTLSSTSNLVSSSSCDYRHSMTQPSTTCPSSLDSSPSSSTTSPIPTATVTSTVTCTVTSTNTTVISCNCSTEIHPADMSAILSAYLRR